MPILERISRLSIKHCGMRFRRYLPRTGFHRTTGSDAKHPSLLAGIAFDENGERLTPSHAVKKGTRYRYYVSEFPRHRDGEGQVPRDSAYPLPTSRT